MHKLIILTFVCLFVASLARSAPSTEEALDNGDWFLKPKDVGTKTENNPNVRNLHRAKRSFYFRGYWTCPIGYIRSPAFTCVTCENYKMITGKSC
ncbi:unnamed protein product [Parnassius mnemosyne]|uniref:Uncharacterized protein n=1 Tax=Parnassius mnemosyne TaxID=213953 RepID=A0AAV1LLI7_9NEOP